MAPKDIPDLGFSANEYAVLLKWMMVSDPWPLSPLEEDRMKKMLNEEADNRGYGDWVHAFHEFDSDEEA